MKKDELPYIQLGGGGMGGTPGGGSTLSSEVTSWVQEHGAAVKESEYADGTTPNSASGTEPKSSSESDSSSQTTQPTLFQLNPSDVSGR